MNSILFLTFSPAVKRSALIVPRNLLSTSTTKTATTSPKSSKKTAAAASNSSQDQDLLKNADPPQSIFRSINKSEILGPGASKESSSDYKNPEYFSYHDQSYNEMEVVMMNLRCEQPKSGRK